MIDFCLDNSSVVLNDEISLIFQQIDILFDTKPKEILGDETYGTIYDNYLYDLKISNESLQQTVLSDIRSLELFGYEPSVEIHLLQGTEQDIVLIEIVLTKGNESYQQIYKIE